MLDRRFEPVRSDRVLAARARLAERLARICLDMPREDFDRMLDDMALIEIKYALRGGDQFIVTQPRKPGPERQVRGLESAS